jgi:hypothetical protein
MTQNETIAAELRAGKRITPLDALRLCGSMRLGARIWELKRAGLAIVCDRVEVETKAGHVARVAEYRLAK